MFVYFNLDSFDWKPFRVPSTDKSAIGVKDDKMHCLAKVTKLTPTCIQINSQQMRIEL